MPFVLNKSKLRFILYLLCVPAVGVLSFYSWKLKSNYLPQMQSSHCLCGSCIKDGDSVFREIINAAPPPFLSSNYSIPEGDFNWWKHIQYTPQNIDYFKMTLEKLFKIFPPFPSVSEAHPDHCRTCAVVGNSGNLAGSHYGHLIDHHDTVIRMNRGRTKGYEEHVGTKTTHHVMYPESAINLDNTTHLVFFGFKMRDMEWLLKSFDPENYNKVDYKRRANKDLVMILNPAFMKYVYEKWLQKKGSYSSTGFMTVILSLVICDEVSVFGFGADSDGNWNHYFEKLGNKNFRTGPHPGAYEYELLEKLHKDKKITFFRGF